MNYKTPIRSRADAQNFIVALHCAGKLFHFDDSPESLAIFDASEISDIQARVGELFIYLDDPFELAVALTNESV